MTTNSNLTSLLKLRAECLDDLVDLINGTRERGGEARVGIMALGLVGEPDEVLIRLNRESADAFFDTLESQEDAHVMIETIGFAHEYRDGERDDPFDLIVLREKIKSGSYERAHG